MFLVMALKRPYWQTEDVRPYLAQAEMEDDRRLSKYLRACRGAMLLDAHVSPDLPQSLLYLAKLTAAAIEGDTPVLVVPTSLKACVVSSEMRSALGRAAAPADLLPHVLNFQLLAENESRGVARTFGMQVFGLPNVAMRYSADTVHQIAGAVQSVAAYQVHCGEAMPIGDTMTIPNLPDLRCIAADGIIPDAEPGEVIGLEWV